MLTQRHRNPIRIRALTGAVLGTALAVTCAPATTGAATAGSDVDRVLEFERTPPAESRTFEVAYLIQCVSNPYCASSLEGMKAAAKKFHFNLKVFDAQFNPGEQLKDAQNALAGKFDGYVLAPTAAAQGCAIYKNYLKPTGKPVVVTDVPMCGDPTATPGVSGTVLMQTQAFYEAIVERAFSSCTASCEAAAVGGYVGTDLFNFWESGLTKAQARHPNVKLVVNQPANFNPQATARIMQDAFSAHPKITLVVSQFDDMTRGALQAVRNAGKQPGKDVHVYSVGATQDGIQRVLSGDVDMTEVTVPYDEGYYAGVVMAMALAGKPLNGYLDEAKLPAVVAVAPDVMLTRANAAHFPTRPGY